MARPEGRNSTLEKQREGVRRKYRMNKKKRRVNFAPGEEDQLKHIAVILKIAQFSNTQIAASIGVTRGQVGDWLKEEKIQKLYLATLEAIPGAAKELLQTYSIEAVHSIANVMRMSDDDKMVLDAAKDILDRSGLPKASRSEVEKNETKKFEFESGSAVDLLRELPVEVQEQAAQLIEDLEKNLQSLAEGREAEVDAGQD